MSAEFHRDTGRLRIFDGAVVIAEWFFPHSWFAIASVAGYSTWGTRPNEQDLALVLDDFILQRTGTRVSSFGRRWALRNSAAIYSKRVAWWRSLTVRMEISVWNEQRDRRPGVGHNVNVRY
jgi:hypothetical protein